MKSTIQHYIQQYPLRVVIFVALFARLIAAGFSGGYAMHDDHFLIVETSGSWVDGKDYNDWLPSTQKKQIIAGSRDHFQPQGHSLVYPGAQYLLFTAFKSMGIDNPKTLMFFNRIFLALLSLWAIVLAFKITELLSDRKTAFTVGIVLAFCWSLPFLSVRNLVEMVCIPFLMWGVYLIAKHKAKPHFFYCFLVGIAFGLSFVIRYQLAVYIFCTGLVLLFQKRWKLIIGMCLGFIVSVGLLQGLLDYLVWGHPFAEFMEYVNYNMSSAKDDYARDLGKSYWFSYIFVLSIMTVPILGFFWLFGIFTQLKKFFWISFPIIGFVAFHSMYINRQERFVFPVVYLVVILGVIGWKAFFDKSNFWKKNAKFWRIILIVSWSLNTLFLVVLTTTYTKRSRVESAYYLYDKPNVKFVIQENTDKGDTPMIPRFYSGKWDYKILSITTPEQLATWKSTGRIPDYIFFYGEGNLAKRVTSFKEKLPQLHFEKTVEPSFFDNLIFHLNPVNKNERIIIYSTRK